MGLRSKIARAKAKEGMRERMGMSDAQAFEASYKEALAAEVTEGIWPSELAAIYEPENCLKHSGAKEVYLVTDKRTGGRLVLRASDLDANERADVEHAILSRLDFPGIPKSYGTFVKDGRSYLAREYFEGEPLDQVIARGVLQPQQIYHVAKQLCTLLGYLHAQNPPVIHRDIKPQNIILRPDGSLGLTDFGIARTFKEGSESDTQYMGTLLYAPPEQYGYAQSSPQTDIYALGIVLIYLATGSPDRRDLERRIADPQLRALIEKCIAFDPKARFQDVAQVVKRIDSMKTRKVRIGALIAAGCLALVLVGVGAWQLFGFLTTSVFPASQRGTSDGSSGSTGAPIELVDASEIIQWNEDDYSSLYEPHIGSTNWLYDYNNSGNLQGNINNGGFAATLSSSNTFFVATADAIYKLNEDGSVASKVYSGTVEGSLNAYGNYLYFTGRNGDVHKVSVDATIESEADTLLTQEISADRIYFDNGRMYCTNMDDNLRLYSVRTDGSGTTKINDSQQFYYTNIVNGIRYYSDNNDGNRIYAQELSTGKTALLFDKPAIWVSVCNGRIYFEDDTASCLASIKLDGTDYQVVYDNPCYSIVATPHGIFAIDAIEAALVVIDATTGESLILCDDRVEFCVAGGWVIYRENSASTEYYLVREDGTDNQQLSFS